MCRHQSAGARKHIDRTDYTGRSPPLSVVFLLETTRTHSAAGPITMIVVVWGRRPCHFGADRNRRGVGHIRQIGPCPPTLQNAGLRQRP